MNLVPPLSENHSRSIALSVAERIAGQGATLVFPIMHAIYNTNFGLSIGSEHPSAKHILTAIRHDPCIFERDTGARLKQLVEGPRRMSVKQASFQEIVEWPSIIIVDGKHASYHLALSPTRLYGGSAPFRPTTTSASNFRLVVTSSITIVDKATKATLTRQQSIVASGNTACYFTRRVHGQATRIHWLSLTKAEAEGHTSNASPSAFAGERGASLRAYLCGTLAGVCRTPNACSLR